MLRENYTFVLRCDRAGCIRGHAGVPMRVEGASFSACLAEARRYGWQLPHGTKDMIKAGAHFCKAHRTVPKRGVK